MMQLDITLQLLHYSRMKPYLVVTMTIMESLINILKNFVDLTKKMVANTSLLSTQMHLTLSQTSLLNKE